MSISLCPISYIKQKPQLLILFVAVLIASLSLYAYSQYAKKTQLSAILMHKIDLINPPFPVVAISTEDQRLSNGKVLPRGTKFNGRLANEGNSKVIYFEDIQSPNGNKLQISGKANLNINPSQSSGVSAKISKTINRQTQSNVIGAIFKNSDSSENIDRTSLKQGTLLRIEVY